MHFLLVTVCGDWACNFNFVGIVVESKQFLPELGEPEVDFAL